MADTVTVLLRLVGNASSARSAIKSVSGDLQKLQGAAQTMKSVGGTLTKAVTLPLIGLGAAATKVAVDFESGFAGVEKTVDGLRTSTGELTAIGAELQEGFRGLAREIPVAHQELLNIGEAAGQLGIRTENILGFTEVMGHMGVTTNLAAQQAAMGLARFANITNMAQTDFDRLGSSIVDLGNNMATTESEIVDMALRIAGAGETIGMTEADIMGFAAALSSVGIQAQAGGTAISRVMVDMQNAVADGGEELQNFAEVAGVTSEQFATLFEDDPARAIEAFVGGLKRIQDEGGNVFTVLEELGMSEIRTRDAMLRLANAGDIVSEALGHSRTAWEENTALTEEAEKRFATTASQIQLLKNNIVDLGITFGSVLLPHLNDLLGVLQQAAEQFATMDDRTRNLIVTIAGIAAAIGPVLWAFGTLAGAVQNIITLFSTLSTVIGGAAAFAGIATVLSEIAVGFQLVAGGATVAQVATLGLTATLGGIAAAVGPILAVVAALGALGYAIYRVSEWEKEHLTTQESIARGYGQIPPVIEETAQAAVQGANDFRALNAQMRENAAINDLATGQMADYAAMARDAGSGVQSFAQQVQEQTAALQEQQAAQAVAETQMQRLAVLIRGPVSQANQQYIDSETEARDKIAELQEELASLQARHGMVTGSQEDLTLAQAAAEKATAKYAQAQQELAENTDPASQLQLEAAVAKASQSVEKANEAVAAAGPHMVDYSQRISEIRGEIAEWEQSVIEAAAAHREAMASVVFDLLQARLAADGWTAAEADMAVAIAESLGMIDQETARVYDNVARTLDNWEAGYIDLEGVIASLTSEIELATGTIERGSEAAKMLEDRNYSLSDSSVGLGIELEAIGSGAEAAQVSIQQATGAMEAGSAAAKMLEDRTAALGPAGDRAEGGLHNVASGADAARVKMQEAIGAASDLAGAINNLPSHKTVTIDVKVNRPSGEPEGWFDLQSPTFVFQSALQNLAQVAATTPVIISTIFNTQSSGPIPSFDSLSEFVDRFKALFNKIKREVQGKAIDKAEEFFNAVDRFVEMLRHSIDLFNEVRDYTHIPQEALDKFQADMDLLLDRFAGWAQGLEDRYNKKIIAKWGDGIEKLLGGIGEGFEVLTGLIDYPQISAEAFARFQHDVTILVASFANWIQNGLDLQFNDQIIGPWGEAIEGVLGGLNAGIELLQDLMSFKVVGIKDVGSPKKTRGRLTYGELSKVLLEQFVKDVVAVIETIGRWVQDTLEPLIDREIVTPWGDAIGVLLEGLAKGVDMLVGISTYRPLPYGVVDEFLGDVYELIIQAGRWIEGPLSSTVDRELVEPWGEVISAMVNGLLHAFNLLDSLGHYRPISTTALFTEFLNDVFELTRRFGAVVSFLEPWTDRETMTRWSELMGPLFGGLKSAIEALGLLKGFKRVDRSSIWKFIDSLGWFVLELQEMVEDFDPRIFEPLTKFSDAATAALQPVQGVVGLLDTLGQVEGLSKGYRVLENNLFFFKDAIRRVVQTVNSLARDLYPELNNGLSEFAAQASDSFGPIGDAADLLGQLAEIGGEALVTGMELFEAHLDHLLIVVEQAYRASQQLAGELAPDLQEEMVTLADVLGEIFDPIEAAAGMLDALSELTRWGLYDGFATFQQSAWMLEQVTEDVYRIVARLAANLLPQLTEAAEEQAEQLGIFARTVSDSVGPITDVLGLLQTLTEKSLTNLLAGYEQIDLVIPLIEDTIRRVYASMQRMADELLVDWATSTTEMQNRIEEVSATITDAFGALDSVVGMFGNFMQLLQAIAMVAGTSNLEALDFAGLTWAFYQFFNVLSFALLMTQNALAGFNVQAIQDAADVIRGIGEALGPLAEAFQNAAATIPPTEQSIEGLLASLVDFYEGLGAYLHLIRERLSDPFEGLSWYGYGQELIVSLIEGINSGIPALTATLANLRAYLPSSPAERGPLSRPVDWSYLAAGLPQTLASIRANLAQPSFSLDLSGQLAAVGAGGGDTFNFNYPPNSRVDLERQIELHQLKQRYRG